ncbi:prephenate dehydrogenase [Lachnospira multipara]|uniref:Prephenate dehydrogenase n=1 Tax=Lachnospira multipara TaxID=28051 RepID=A0A1H5VK65_9FIRM|nr:prephenate dehydrogenase/arogenate dehydrogenase family protein [Lachnospira multipara]MBQ2473381.1 prephenate dehydrogenase/arogenate dehydrogenase family protein [Lachnospira sp.]SEF87600.1 prephenate dehydrogenase [Lachnospira multipara]
MEDVKVGFIGFGLIAGSIAHALKETKKPYTIIATSRRIDPILKAKEDGVVDTACECIDDNFKDCDIIILCTPVVTITSYLCKLKSIIKPGCIITDVGSVKTIIHKEVSKLGLDNCFIGGHPMAGSEKTGYENSSSAILNNAKYIITPTPLTTMEQLNFFQDFVRDTTAKPLIMDYETHDRTVAGISHLPHLISTALVKVVSENDDPEGHMHCLAAGSFRDMSRVAASSPEMWEQICISNSDAISGLLGQYIDILNEIKTNLDNKTPGYVASLFEDSRHYKLDKKVD